MTANQKKTIKASIFITVITLLVFAAYRYLLSYILPFIFAYWLARLFIPVVEYMKAHWRVPKSLGATIVLSLFSAVFGVIIFFLFRTLIIQLEAFLKNIPVYQQYISSFLDALCDGCDNIFRLDEGSTNDFVSTNMNYIVNTVKEDIMPVITEQAWTVLLKTAGFFCCIFVIFIGALLLINDLPKISEFYKKSFFYEDVHAVLGGLNNVLSAYFRMQGIIISIIATVCTLGFLLIHNEYALLFGIFVAVFDAFPVLGSGLILIPWAIIRLLAGDFFSAAVLASLFFICQLIRQTMEPRLLGSRIGILPIFTIISVFAGIKLYGISGVFLGPLSLVTIQIIYKNFCKI